MSNVLHKVIMKRSRLRNTFLKHWTDTNKKTTILKDTSVKNSWKALRNLILKILTQKKLLITDVSGGHFYHYLPKIHQKVKKLTISSDAELCESFNLFFYNAVPTLNIPKPKSFPMESDNLHPIMSVIKSFNKNQSIVKFKAKALSFTFNFRKTGCNEVEKTISNLLTSKKIFPIRSLNWTKIWLLSL